MNFAVRVSGRLSRRWKAAFAAGCVGCASPAPSTVATAAATAQPGALRAIEREVTARVDAHRGSRGLQVLEHSEVVAELARAHSRAMASGEVGFGHAGMQRRARELAARLPFAGMGENVSRQPREAGLAALAVEGWLDSRVHRKNIEGDYQLTGVGAARAPDGNVYLTQIFVRTGP